LKTETRTGYESFPRQKLKLELTGKTERVQFGETRFKSLAALMGRQSALSRQKTLSLTRLQFKSLQMPKQKSQQIQLVGQPILSAQKAAQSPAQKVMQRQDQLFGRSDSLQELKRINEVPPPGFLRFGGDFGSDRGGRSGSSKLRLFSKYSPSLSALYFGYSGGQKGQTVGGVGVRPVGAGVRTKKKKKR